MAKKTRNASKPRVPQRRVQSLSRERIVAAAIELLDDGGENALTFKALSEHLATGPGAIYWHVADKSDLVTAACDAVIARTMAATASASTPQAAVQALALGLFDAMAAHPWIGGGLSRVQGQMPVVRIVEGLARQVGALGVPEAGQWATVAALLNYILGFGGRNAANTQFARAKSLKRADVLDRVSGIWLQLDPKEFPFAHRAATRLVDHDDRADFLAGIDLILGGIDARARSVSGDPS